MTTDYQSQFETKLFEMYPDVVTSGSVSRKQIVDVMDALGSKKYPTWIMENKLSRGVYAIAGGKAVTSAPVIKLPTPTTVSMIPNEDPNYVPFGNHKDLDTIIKSGIFYPTYVSGPTGNGKSTMVEQICATHKRDLIRVNLNVLSDEEQLVGSKTLTDGNVEIVEGPVLIAMRTGSVLLLDEIDAGGANALLCLQPILEGKPYYFKLKNETIVPAPGFNIIATANTKGKGSDDGRYIGTNILNEAFLERFAVTFNQDYPPASTELKIALNLMKSYNCVNEEFAQTLVKWADAIRRTYEDGGVDELITTRRLVHVIRAYSIFNNTKKAVELCCNRFDDVTKEAFIDLYDKIDVGLEETQEVPVETTSTNPF